MTNRFIIPGVNAPIDYVPPGTPSSYVPPPSYQPPPPQDTSVRWSDTGATDIHGNRVGGFVGGSSNSGLPEAGQVPWNPQNTPGFVDTSKWQWNGTGYASYQGFLDAKAQAEARNQELIRQQQLRQQQFNQQANRQLTQGAASAAHPGTVTNPNTGQAYGGAAGDRLNVRLKRNQNQTDNQQTGAFGVQQTSQPVAAPNSMQMNTSYPADNAPKTMPAGPSKPAPTGKTAGGKPGETQAPPPNPQSGLLRQLATTEADPYMQILLNGYADQLDSYGNPQAMGQDQFMQGADAQSIARPFDAIQTILDNARSFAQTSQQSKEAFMRDSFNRQDKYLAAQEENQKQQLQFQQDQAVRQERDNQRKHLDNMSIVLALEGGFGSHDGNMELETARMEGERAITDLTKEFGFKMADVSLAFTQAHNQAYDSFRERWLTATDNFEARVSDIDLQGISNQSAKSNALRGAYKDYVGEIKAARKEMTDTFREATGMVYEAHQKEKDDLRAREELGWSILNTAYDNYKGNIPQTILDRVAQLVPGIDPTQLGARREAGSGGYTGASFADSTGMAGQFSDLTPQQLSSAVDRAMLKFGGTGAERNRKRAEYMDRIARGEPAQSIVSDLIADYWATTTGDAERTHNERRSASSSMDTVLSYASAYGLNDENDGPMGPVSSKAEWLGSWFGRSSDAYNDISGIVGAAKGAITRANAGTAVTPWELKLISEYAPSMELKGPKFFSNVRNYKKMVEYFDAKQAATDLGLPPPPPPVPVSQSGNAVAGPGKYTQADLANFLK